MTSSPARAPGALLWPELRDPVAWAILVLGFLVRWLHYSANRSLWLDEAMLSISVTERSIPELLQPLVPFQAAPFGFLALSRLAVEGFGASELSLRLFPWLASLVSLALFWCFARNRLGRNATRFALLLFALSPGLVYFGAEVKQYSVDVLCALLVYVSADLVEARPASRASGLMFFLMGAVSVWLSHPVVLILACVAAVEFSRARANGDTGRARLLVRVTLGWSLSFASSLWIARDLLGNSLLREFWSEGFMPFPPHNLGELAWLPNTLLGLVAGVVQMSHRPSSLTGGAAMLGLALLLAGGWVIGRRRPGELILLAGPFCLGLIASALQLYPVKGRLALFLLPAVIVLIAASLEAARAMDSRGMRLAAVAAGAFFVVAPATSNAAWFVWPAREEIRPLLQQVAWEAEEDSVIYVHSGARHAFHYYAENCESCRSGGRVQLGRFFHSSDDSSAIATDLASLVKERDVWLIFTHEWWSWGEGQRQAMVDFLDRCKVRTETIETRGAWAYRFTTRTLGQGTSAVSSCKVEG